MEVGHAVVVEVQEGEDGVLRASREVDVQAASGGGRDHVEVHAGLPHAVLEEGEAEGREGDGIKRCLVIESGLSGGNDQIMNYGCSVDC